MNNDTEATLTKFETALASINEISQGFLSIAESCTQLVNTLRSQLRAREEWQPIESAPPTSYNNRILLLCKSKARAFNGRVVLEGYWFVNAGKGQWETNYNYKLTPLYWQPLPNPPGDAPECSNLEHIAPDVFKKEDSLSTKPPGDAGEREEI